MEHTRNKLLLWEMNLVDINNDLGFKKISSIIEQLPEDVQPTVLSALRDIQERGVEKVANEEAYLLSNSHKLPLNSYSNILLSKVYLVGQEDNIPTSIYKVASEKIDKLCAFFDIDTSNIKLNGSIEKTASLNDYITMSIQYLLPEEQLFPVASKGDLEKAASVYSDNESKLLIEQKVRFARNFVKVAADYDVVDIPTYISKYASILDSDIRIVADFLEKRADWVKIHNPAKKLEIDMLNKLASAFRGAEDDKTVQEFTGNINNLNKLAYIIDNIDTSVGIGAKQYKTIFPDCFGTVFNKEASSLPPVGLGITKNDTDTEAFRDVTREERHIDAGDGNYNVTKAEILTAFGEDVLADLVDDSGNLDQERAYKLLRTINR